MRFVLVELFYNDCDEATVRWAFEHLTPETAGDTATEPVSVPNFWAADLLVHATSTTPNGPLSPD